MGISILILLCTMLMSTTLISSETSYIVHMDSQAKPAPFSTHHTWYSSLLLNESDLIYTYTNSIHGFCATLSPAQLDEIKKHPAYLSSTRDQPLKFATTHSSDFLGLNSFTGAWPASGFGRGVIIGVVDSGIWPESKSFDDQGMPQIPHRWKGGCFGGIDFNSSSCNRKLIGARFFNKGMKAANPHANILLDSARDTFGHGTHVSSIAAGNFVHGAHYFGYGEGTARGMAPRAFLAIYAPAYDDAEDGTYASDLTAAIDSAVADGIDVLSLSIASSGALWEDPVTIATFAAMERGIFVTRAAGNSGHPLGSINGAAPWDLTVAASTLDREFTATILLGDGLSITGSSIYPLNDMVIPAHLPLVYVNACGNISKSVAYKMVVCHVNYNEDLEPFIIAERFIGTGVAAAIVIIDNAFDIPWDEVGFPTTFLSAGKGKAIVDYIHGNDDPRATVKFKETCHGHEPSTKVARFSSRGPCANCPAILKPDVMAPGDFILASWQEKSPVNTVVRKINSFSIESGTSMASPHVAGVAALVKGANPDWSPAMVRSAIMTTAKLLDNSHNPIQEWGTNQTASPLAMGAGLVDPNRALDPGLVYDLDAQDYVNFLCGLNLSKHEIRTITRSSQYVCPPYPSLDLNYPSFIAYFNCNGTKSVQFRRTLTNLGRVMSRYVAKLDAMQGLHITVEPETLVFRAKNEKQSYKLTLEGPCLSKGTVLHSNIKWVGMKGNHTVTSPIAVVSL